MINTVYAGTHYLTPKFLDEYVHYIHDVKYAFEVGTSSFPQASMSSNRLLALKLANTRKTEIYGLMHHIDREDAIRSSKFSYPGEKKLPDS